ncbi:lipid-binding SYLF domain-containing protein [Mangrovimonas sp. AS39]|uniref:lipid-binding SYLF domain-containing protein n=1 Tax=Mangrovimonas TaxID=1211036 RepID=UPI0014239F5D|nr:MULTISPECIES: lipid-binding SYLF domain-containing protein [Mangrovimonas]MCF1191864.1 lipid-binding SYLF domain-containing protein [Mangrovimonas futianensis]MCF1195248.1 lipid-binding SYLF domain-containing protein [Mangrovimonas futianensis]MCF1422153.1 lipid-binding SYLF domain-containing protein [Mangrovimonas futianensis]NIK91709.1 lipid-binding SYLF domain-containing protein [Mangrovimonas sp. CR14]
MKRIKSILVVLSVCFFTLSGYTQSEKDKKVIKDADEAVSELLKYNPSLRTYFDKAAGCVIFPNVGKGGLIIGGASGNGVVYSYGQKIGMASLKELNVGFQAGGQALIEVIFFEKKEDLEKFKEGNFEFDAGISATALKSSVSLDAKYTDGVAVFTHTKGGLMAEVSVGGQKFKYEPF